VFRPDPRGVEEGERVMTRRLAIVGGGICLAFALFYYDSDFVLLIVPR
jgi:hypothetical protein